MAKYFLKVDVHGGEKVRKAGTSVEIKDESNVDQALFYRSEEQDEPVPEKQLEVATPKPRTRAEAE